MNIELGHGLCFRCEYRAAFFDTGYGPRYECGKSGAVHSCYMFIPTKPIAVGPIEGEKRPIFGPWMVAGCKKSYGLINNRQLRLKLIDLGDGKLSAVWTIKPERKIKGEQK